MESATQKFAILDNTPVISLVLYTTGDNIGGLMTLPGAVKHPGHGGSIRWISLIDKLAISADIDVLVFDKNPSNSTFTDNEAAVVSDLDVVNLVAVFTLRNWVTLAGNSVVSLNTTITSRDGPNVPFIVFGGQTLFAAMIIRAGATYTTTDALKLRIVVDRTG